MNILICGIISVYLTTQTVGTITAKELSRDVDHAISICKLEPRSNGCLVSYRRHLNYSKIKCGEKL